MKIRCSQYKNYSASLYQYTLCSILPVAIMQLELAVIWSRSHFLCESQTSDTNCLASTEGNYKTDCQQTSIFQSAEHHCRCRLSSTTENLFNISYFRMFRFCIYNEKNSKISNITGKYSENNLMREMCCYEYSWDAHTDLDNPKNTPE